MNVPFNSFGLLADQPEPASLVDVCFAWIVVIGRRGTGRTVHPKRVEFQRPETHRKCTNRTSSVR